jgi:tRNA pseudouridine55 synthase
VDIYDITVTRIDLPFVGFEVACSAGTYIRALSADIGKSLGCGAHLQALKRVASSGFELAQAAPLVELEELARSRTLHRRMISMRDALPAMPESYAADELVARILHGRSLSVQDLKDPLDFNGLPEPYVKIIDGKGSLVAIVERRPASQRLSYCCVFGQPDK